MARKSPLEQAEAELTAFGLTLPETSAGPAWTPARGLYVRKGMFAVFGARGEGREALTIIVKLPVAAEMVQDLWFVQPAKGWFKQHDWVIARFTLDDDITAEMETLKAWLVQSYCARAPKKLAREVEARFGLGRG